MKQNASRVPSQFKIPCSLFAITPAPPFYLCGNFARTQSPGLHAPHSPLPRRLQLQNILPPLLLKLIQWLTDELLEASERIAAAQAGVDVVVGLRRVEHVAFEGELIGKAPGVAIVAVGGAGFFAVADEKHCAFGGEYFA